MQIVMKRADRFFREEQQKPRLTTGIKALDTLIDSIRPGQFYLFYSANADLLDHVIHQILVSGSLLTNRGGDDIKTLYFNTCNYHLGKTLLHPSRLATIAKQRGIDPKSRSRNIYAIAAFNEIQQVSAMNEVADLVQQDPAIQLVIIHNITRFIETSIKPNAAQQMLKQIVGLLKRAVAARDVALVLSCAASKPWQGRIPKPIGGTYLRHEAHVVVLLDHTRATMPFAKITLVKHPYNETPQSLFLYAGRREASLTEDSVPSFQQQVHKIVNGLRMTREFEYMLRPQSHQVAFDHLIQDAWSREGLALAATAFPHTVDAMNMMANIHNKHCEETLRQRVDALEHMIKEQDNDAL
jgi:hypothetical protein